jgi:putative transposase
MPNHFHLILKTAEEKTISGCMANFKRLTSRHIGDYLKQIGNFELLKKLSNCAIEEPVADCRIWKPRFDCFNIILEKTLIQKINYCHYNPVKAGLVSTPEDWPYSSASNYAGVKNELLSIDTDWKCLNE